MSQSLDRLYELLPAVYRLRDSEQGYALRALLQVIAEQVNVVEDDIARLYDNWFIETCDDWVVPYIADLIGYKPVGEAGSQNEANSSQAQQLNKILIPRRDVADTIHNRRRKGALSLLEELTSDVVGWPSRVVEFYKLLGWTQNLNHRRPLRGRTVNLRKGAALDLIGSAFDSSAHTVDVRRLSSHLSQGRYNLPSIGVFVWRLKSYSMTHTSAHCLDEIGPHVYTFSTLGNHTQLYNRPQKETEATHIAEELNLPVPIRRRAFEKRLVVREKVLEGRDEVTKEVERGQASGDYYGLGKSLVIWAADWPHRNAPQPIPCEKIIPADLSKRIYRAPQNHIAVDPKLGRIIFPPGQTPRRGVKVTYHYAFSADIGGGEYRRALSQADGASIYLVKKNHEKPGFFNTIQEAISQWNADKKAARKKVSQQNGAGKSAKQFDAVIEICDSEVYIESEPLMVHLEANDSLQIRAANVTRPIIKILDYSDNFDALLVSGKSGSRFTLDGLLISGRGIRISGQAGDMTEGGETNDYGDQEYQNHSHAYDNDSDKYVSESGRYDDTAQTPCDTDEPPTPNAAADLCSVTIRHSTLVPGWDLHRDCEPKNDEPSLLLDYTRARVKIEHSIIGSIQVEANQVESEPVQLHISDSIVDATNEEGMAISSTTLPTAYTSLIVERSTIIGEVHTHSIELAENSIFDGRVRVARRQFGCVRFCYVKPASRTPRRYLCQPDTALAKLTKVKKAPLTDEEKLIEQMRLSPQFNSKRYSTPAYCQLAESCADEIKRGADDEAELGVFHNLYQPQRAANLRARLDEYTPADMDAGVIYSS
jgi:hypothetical protein